jgi:NAD(P)-dependent dehydrogenase (short-subunit alcohol dehydrogenase family)
MAREHRIAVVTGAGRGLGEAVAGALGHAGYRVALVDITVEELQATESALIAQGIAASAFRVDVTDEQAVTGLVEAVHRTYGVPHVLVNAAAILEERRFDTSDLAHWQRTLAVNLTGPWLCTRAFLPEMIAAGRGSVISVTSRAGIEPFVGETAYCAAKFGLEGFSRALALELAGSGVVVNLITPGVSIKPTSLTTADFAALPPEQRARYTDPALLTTAFLYLATADAKEINGERFDAYQLSQQLRDTDHS